MNITTRRVYETELTQCEREDMHALQVRCFADVPYDEIMEDFVARSIAKVLAYDDDTLVGCVSVFKRRIEYAGQPIVLGGFGGTCTRDDLRGRGIGTAVCQVAMDALRDEGCDIAMLAVGAGSDTDRFYERFGFRLLSRPFLFVNVHGQVKQSHNDEAMIAPVCSPPLFDLVLHGDAPLNIGPEPGYW